METRQAQNLDMTQFQRVEDIIFLDEPILTHLKQGGKDYFQYLVQSTTETDIYLIFEVDEMSIFEYLTGTKSLWQIIKENESFFYRIEEDFHGKVLNTEVLVENQLDPNYLPSKDSFLEYKPTTKSYYHSFIEELRAQAYLINLRKNAFYLKIKPNNTKYRDTIGFMELSGHLLGNISESYSSFVKADFYSQFKDSITDEKKLKKSFKSVKSEVDYRAVDFRFGSFEIGLAVDKVMKKNIQDKKLFNWAVEVGEKYNQLVLDEDYDQETVDKILEKYSPEERKKIFEPIFKITEDPNYILSKKGSGQKEYRAIKVRERDVVERIIPPVLTVPQVEEKKELKVMRITAVINSKDSKRSIKLDDNNTLFDALDSSDYILHKKDFQKYGYDLEQDIEVPLQISTEGETITLTAEYGGKNFKVVSTTMDDGMKKITSKICEYLLDHE